MRNNILYLGQTGGKEAYYDEDNERLVVFVPAWLDARVSEAFSIIEILRVPLVLGLSLALYFVLRNARQPVMPDGGTVFPLVILAAVAGMAAAFLLAGTGRKAGAERMRRGRPATHDERVATLGKARHDTTVVVLLLPVLLVFLIGMPFLLPKIGTLPVFLGYMAGWFLFGLACFSFRPVKRMQMLKTLL